MTPTKLKPFTPADPKDPVAPKYAQRFVSEARLGRAITTGCICALALLLAIALWFFVTDPLANSNPVVQEETQR